MPDVELQLRTYFDEVVERVTADDVFIRATTEPAVRLPDRRFRRHPIAAGAIGFGLAVTLLGVVLVIDRLFGVDSVDPDTGGSSTLTDPGSWVSPWAAIPVAVGLGFLTTGVINARRRRIATQGRGNMQTMEQVDSTDTRIDNEMLRLEKRNRWLSWLLGILAVAVVGMGVWLAAEVTSSDDASLTSEVQVALDAYLDAWDTTDGAAFLAATTADYTFVSNGREFGVEDRAASLDVLSYWRTERLGLTVAGDGPYYVAIASRVYPSALSEGNEGQSIMTIEQVDDTWKVSQHTWIGNL